MGSRRIVGKGCIAAPLLGGGWGCVDLQARNTMGISALDIFFGGYLVDEQIIIATWNVIDGGKALVAKKQ